VQRWMDATGKVATLEDGKRWTKIKASRAASARKTALPGVSCLRAMMGGPASSPLNSDSMLATCCAVKPGSAELLRLVRELIKG